MQSRMIGTSEIRASRLVYGCMRIAGDGISADTGRDAVLAAVDAGFTLFDHADLYGGGQSERVFGEVLRDVPGLRDQVRITSKCGIRLAGDSTPDAPKRYDFSRGYILESVEGSLQRLGIEQLDLFLLHRPDFLMDTAEVAGTFDALHSSGKVAAFGVSNFSVPQLEALQSATPHKLQVNQVEINIHNIEALTNGVLDQCQRREITPQAWCPLGGVVYPSWGSAFGEADDARIRAEFERQSTFYETEPWIIMLAWLLRHPARISPIIGSTTPTRIRAAVSSLDVDYSREDWYRLLEARLGEELP